MFIERIINIFFQEYTNSYLDIIKNKLKILFKTSKTKRVIVDETNDVLKRIIIVVADELNLEIEFLPHGIICEDEHVPALNTLSKNFKVLTWNKNSQKYFNKFDIKAESVNYPVTILKNKIKPKKDLLVLMSGDRRNLNNFEGTITTLLSNLMSSNLNIDWKYHTLNNKEQIDVMSKQQSYIENFYNIKLNTIHHTVKLTNIIRNYNKILFTTWGTGIFEAALLNIPFLIFTKELYKINAFEGINMPVATNMDKCKKLIFDDNMDYLKEIRQSIINNTPLNDYINK